MSRPGPPVFKRSRNSNSNSPPDTEGNGESEHTENCDSLWGWVELGPARYILARLTHRPHFLPRIVRFFSG